MVVRGVYVRVGLIRKVDLAHLVALVNTPGGTKKERNLRNTRHLSPFHVCQPCRDGITTRSKLISSTSNAGESREQATQGELPIASQQPKVRNTLGISR